MTTQLLLTIDVAQAWDPIHLLQPADAAPQAAFGLQSAIHGNRAIVTTYYDPTVGPHNGAAYLFDVTTGQQVAKLSREDGSVAGNFGWSVDMNDTVAIVGSPTHRRTGAAFVYESKTGALLGSLTPSDGSPFDRFGQTVAVNSSVAVVSSYYSEHHSFDGLGGYAA